MSKYIDQKSRLDHKFTVTAFSSQAAQTKATRELSLRQLQKEIILKSADHKSHLPWFKMAVFGGKPTQKGCLRNDSNVLAVTGAECDYDDGKITPQEAVSLLEKAGITALVYTTPSHSHNKPRWRVMAPLFKPVEGSTETLKKSRAALVARLNGLFDGNLDGASFNLSQSFYAGNIKGKPKIETFLIEGQRFIDEADSLDKTALGKKQKRTGKGKTGRVVKRKDESRSGDAWLFLLDCARKDMNEDQAEQAIASDNSPAGDWYRTAPNMEHQFPNSWKRAKAAIQLKIDKLFERLDIEPEEKLVGKLATIAPDASENGAAKLFASLHGNSWRYDQTQDLWLYWTGHYWKPDRHKGAFNAMRLVCEALAYMNESPARSLLRASAVSGAERLARTLPEISTTSEEWDINDWLLGTPGGVVDLKTGNLREGLPQDRITKVAAVAPIPKSEFDPHVHCPNWLAFLESATGNDPALILFLQSWFGYNLTGSTREHALLFVHGPGGTGKSTIINVIGDLLGEYCVNVESETLTESRFERHSTELARLDGTRMARVSEVKAGKRWEQKRIIALTGGDRITARYMRQDNFEFTPRFKLTIVGNSRPGFAQMDSAIERRMIIVPFDKKPDKPDRELPKKLEAEGPGILAWLIEGCINWQKNGLVRPQIVKDYTREYTSEQDVFSQWVRECCETSTDKSDTTANLWQSWSDFAYNTGENPGNRRGEFADRLREHGFGPSTHCGPQKTKRGFKGLVVKQESGISDLFP